MVKLVPVSIESKKVFENLMSLYLHELSLYTEGLEINSDGVFEYDGIDLCFSRKEIKPFFIYYKNRIAGFVLILSGNFTSTGVDYSIHEFFILRAYRRIGVGTAAVKKVFAMYKGIYKVTQLIKNIPAINFWKSFYENANIKYEEWEELSGGDKSIFQIFSIK